MTCKYCGEEFVPARSTQKFCCRNHQQAYWKGVKPIGATPKLSCHPLDMEQMRINREIDDRHAIQCDPGRSIKGKEFRELAKLYAGRDERRAKSIGFLFQWNRAVGICRKRA